MEPGGAGAWRPLINGQRRGSPGLFGVLLAAANSDANRLYEDLMMTYNRIVRPVQNNSDRVVVRLGLKLSQLMDVEWSDYKLKWDPSEYGGIEDINLPAEQIWLPDIALYNSAEGYFAVSIMTKAKVRYNGHVTWNPPAIFRSSCQIDITYFPFDSQNCHLKFGSWTFGTKLDLRHINDTEGTIERGTDLSEYYQNVEWDIMQASARRNVITYICCPNDFYPDVTFNFTLRRKPLFYTVNLILPCIGITFFSFLVFYLPSDSGEKVTLTISILVSLIFFLSVLIETIPSTSLAMPLLGKYLVFTMILITLSVCATVCVLNIHFRTPSTHSMPPWIKRWCMDILPKYLFMSVPQYQSQQANILPEQLIYLHNQAYATQAVSLPPQQPSSEVKKQQPETSEVLRKHHETVVNMTDHQTNQTRTTRHQISTGAWLSASANKTAPLMNNGSNKNRPEMASCQSSSRPSARHPLELNASNLLGVNNANSSQQGQASSFFLPYLQSETARRLQLQRSRSSERDRSTSDNQHSSNNGINCDKGLSSLGNTGRQQKPPVRPKSADSHDRDKRKQTETSDHGKSKSSFWHLFKSSKSTSERDGHQQPTNQVRLSTSSSTSSALFDPNDDYQHHRHFQARASICSNNLWRIGPTRRCSLAVPTNYPTYYRPLAQLQHHHQLGQTVNTIGGCLQKPTLYHIHGDDSSQSSSSSDAAHRNHHRNGSRGAIRTPVTTATTNLMTRSKLVPTTQNPEETITSDGFISIGAQLPHAVGAMPPRHQVEIVPPLSRTNFSSHPPPPSPIPPAEFRGPSQLSASGYVHRNQPQQSIWRTDLVAGNASVTTESQKMNHMGHNNNNTNSATNVTCYQPYRQSCSLTNSINQMQQLSGQFKSSIPSGYHQVSLSGDQNFNMIDTTSNIQRPQQHQSPQLLTQQLILAPPNDSMASHQHLGPQYAGIGQLMPRSRSTDHRLSSIIINSSNGLNQPNDRIGLQKPQIHQINRQPIKWSTQGQHSIGRALGQVYMQRLQRQPTIYSLHSGISPNAQRDKVTMNLIPLDGQLRRSHQQQRLGQHRLQQPSIEMMRRSMSQTSLNRRPQYGLGAIDCEHCIRGAGFRQDEFNFRGRPRSEIRDRLNSASGCVAAGGSFKNLPREHNKESPRCVDTCANCTDQGCLNGSIKVLIGGPHESQNENNTCRCGSAAEQLTIANHKQPPLSTLNLMKLISEVEKAIQNAMFIAQHIDNLDEFESVKENWKYIAMVIDRIFLIVFLFACIVGTVAIFALVPWSNYITEKPIDLQLTRLLALNITEGEPYLRTCQDLQ